MNMLTENLPKGKLINLSVLLFLALVLPAAVLLVQQVQIINKNATVNPIKAVLSPATITKNKGDSFTLTVNLTNISTSDKGLRVATTKLQFDPNVLEVQGTKTGTAYCGPKNFTATPCDATNFSQEACARVYDSDARVELSCFRRSADGILTLTASQSKALASVTFVVKNTATVGATTTVTITDLIAPDAVDSTDLSDGKENTVITIGTGGTGTPTLTPTPTGPSVDLKFMFRDVTVRPASCYRGTTLNFKVKMVKDGVAQTFNPVALAPTDANITADGIWTLRVYGFNKAAGNYNIYIKGPKQLQKKFPNKALTAAESQTVDLTPMGAKYYLEGGDLPIGDNGAQDGVVNSIDANSLVNCFADPESAACVAKADLNFDCIITSGDVNLMNNTIFTRWEDDEQP
ncbi:hypothetical protein COY91_02345 [Candidatus Shapirobacteria bacterium CG_4_10_14_0_8_um_filter_39_15]|nr:MAG: hypothetical protein COY91_02345 [Candidatus Shapirobacteria bacterium CG_4_10_14_0_8_um_filter_39_15]